MCLAAGWCWRRGTLGWTRRSCCSTTLCRCRSVVGRRCKCVLFWYFSPRWRASASVKWLTSSGKTKGYDRNCVEIQTRFNNIRFFQCVQAVPLWGEYHDHWWRGKDWQLLLPHQGNSPGWVLYLLSNIYLHNIYFCWCRHPLVRRQWYRGWLQSPGPALEAGHLLPPARLLPRQSP